MEKCLPQQRQIRCKKIRTYHITFVYNGWYPMWNVIFNRCEIIFCSNANMNFPIIQQSWMYFWLKNMLI